MKNFNLDLGDIVLVSWGSKKSGEIVKKEKFLVHHLDDLEGNSLYNIISLECFINPTRPYKSLEDLSKMVSRITSDDEENFAVVDVVKSSFKEIYGDVE